MAATSLLENRKHGHREKAHAGSMSSQNFVVPFGFARVCRSRANIPRPGSGRRDFLLSTNREGSKEKAGRRAGLKA
jgi:hypothetical protein